MESAGQPLGRAKVVGSSRRLSGYRPQLHAVATNPCSALHWVAAAAAATEAAVLGRKRERTPRGRGCCLLPADCMVWRHPMTPGRPTGWLG